MTTELPERPESREESYLADIAGQEVVLPEAPLSRKEQYLAYIAENGGGGGGGTNNFNQLTNRPKYNGVTMTGDTNIPQVKTYTAGSNVTISDNTISATDTTYSDFTGTDGTAAGTAGLVPAPATTDAGKFLKADGTWDTAGGGSGEGFVELTSADYNYPVDNPSGIHPMYLVDGAYKLSKGLNFWNMSGVTTSSVVDTLSTDMYLFVSQKDANDKRAYYVYSGGSGAGDSRGKHLAVCLVGRANQNDYLRSFNTVLSQDVVDELTSTSTIYPLSANQGKVLKDLIDSLVIKNAGAPTTSTVGTVGQLLEDTTNGKLYQCTAVSGNTYTWTEVGAGGGSSVTVVQTTGTSTTDVMSQNATSSMIFDDPGTNKKVKIGTSLSPSSNAISIGVNSKASGTTSVAIGKDTWAQGNNAVSIGQATADGVNSVAIGNAAYIGNTNTGSVALGAYSATSHVGEVNIGSTAAAYGYNSSNYRLLSGLYDGQTAHDAATVGQLNGLITMTTTDPGEGTSIAANTFIAVYNAS